MIPVVKEAKQKAILRALQGEAMPSPPFWFMRQAGRYLPEYRALREKAGSFLNLCFDPGLAVEITLQPLRRFDMDAAILFSDILVVPYALGQDLAFVEGEGPRLGALDIKSLVYDKSKLAPVYEALRRLRLEMHPEKALIGFAGAPFTLACYMMTGKGDGKFEAACLAAQKRDPFFSRLMDILTRCVGDHLCDQIAAGADAVQLFDSWAGLLDGVAFEDYVIVPARKIRDHVKSAYPSVPLIGFPRGAGKNYPAYAEGCKMNAIGIDQSTTMDWAAQHVSPAVCLQGNLDPQALLEGGKRLEKETRTILEAMRGRALVFNLGHGVIKETPPEHVADLCKIVRSFS